MYQFTCSTVSNNSNPNMKVRTASDLIMIPYKLNVIFLRWQYLVLAALMAVAVAADSVYPAPAAYTAPAYKAYDHKAYDYVSKTCR